MTIMSDITPLYQRAVRVSNSTIAPITLSLDIAGSALVLSLQSSQALSLTNVGIGDKTILL